jgi:hypothetical protein
MYPIIDVARRAIAPCIKCREILILLKAGLMDALLILRDRKARLEDKILQCATTNKAGGTAERPETLPTFFTKKMLLSLDGGQKLIDLHGQLI